MAGAGNRVPHVRHWAAFQLAGQQFFSEGLDAGEGASPPRRAEHDAHRATLRADLDRNRRTKADTHAHPPIRTSHTATAREPFNHRGFGSTSGGGGIRTHE
jgi:hypothetical protein